MRSNQISGIDQVVSDPSIKQDKKQTQSQCNRQQNQTSLAGPDGQSRITGNAFCFWPAAASIRQRPRLTAPTQYFKACAQPTVTILFWRAQMVGGHKTITMGVRSPLTGPSQCRPTAFPTLIWSMIAVMVRAYRSFARAHRIPPE